MWSGLIEVPCGRVRQFQAVVDPLGVPVVEHRVHSGRQVGAVPGGNHQEPVALSQRGPAFRLTGQARGTRGDLVPEPGPAGEAVLAGHGQLHAGQGQRVLHRPDAAGGRGVARPRGVLRLCLAMAAQVVQEAPGGGDGAGRAVDGLGGGAGRGPGQVGHDRDVVGDPVSGFLHGAGAGRDVHPELVRAGGLGPDVVQLRPNALAS